MMCMAIRCRVVQNMGIDRETCTVQWLARAAEDARCVQPCATGGKANLSAGFWLFFVAHGSLSVTIYCLA
jgi:hypothetical protein